MSVEIQVPVLGESLNTATIARWLKKTGDYVHIGENILELETDKVSVDVASPASGTLEIKMLENTEVNVGTVIGTVSETKEKSLKEEEISSSSPSDEQKTSIIEEQSSTFIKNLEPNQNSSKENIPSDATHRTPMNRLRKTIAQNLKKTQNTAALLTTFNEVDMTSVRELRTLYRDEFAKKYDGTRLGFMSFFAKAVVSALKDYPILNAQIDNDDIVYHDHINLGIAVGTERGLVVPVLQQAEKMNFAEIERQVSNYGQRARDGSLTLDELSNGSFTITNGGIFGSLLSTPIINGSQSGVLGMHAIQDRPVARNGQVVIRPMMYVALSYDHRLVDGREAVSFLVRLKELLEDPRRFILEI